MKPFGLLLPLAAIAAAIVPSARAETITPSELAGWWLSIDETQPKLWAGGYFSGRGVAGR